MNSFEKEVLNGLLDRYEKSVLSRGGSGRRRSITLRPKDRELQTYAASDSYRYRQENDGSLRELERRGFLTVCWDRDGNFESLSLNAENVDGIYAALGRENPKRQAEEAKAVLEGQGTEGIAGAFAAYCREFIEKNYRCPREYFDDAAQLEKILTGLNAMEKLTEETRRRYFSVRTYGDSKTFERLQGKIVKIIRNFDPQCDAEEPDDILAEHYIVRNPTYAFVRQNLTFRLNGVRVDLNALGFEYALSDGMIRAMEIEGSGASRVITVENLTSFHALCEENAVIVYLGGFHNHTKNMLLKKLYGALPDAEYLHFGDIDAGGFQILRHLRRATGIPFSPYRMGIPKLESHRGSLKSLTDSDRERLTRMRDDEEFQEFRETFCYMLDNGVKLEQEILD